MYYDAIHYVMDFYSFLVDKNVAADDFNEKKIVKFPKVNHMMCLKDAN